MKTVQYPEIELISAMRNRDPKAFAYIYNIYGASIFTVIRGFVCEPTTATDLLQDVFIHVWQRFDTFDPARGRLFTWLHGIARNICLDYLRSKRFRNTQVTVTADKLDEQLLTCASEAARIHDAYGLDIACGQLPEREKQIVRLAYYEGYTRCQIACLTGCSVNTVKTRLARALKRLRAIMAGNELVWFIDDEWPDLHQSVTKALAS